MLFIASLGIGAGLLVAGTAAKPVARVVTLYPHLPYRHYDIVPRNGTDVKALNGTSIHVVNSTHVNALNSTSINRRNVTSVNAVNVTSINAVNSTSVNAVNGTSLRIRNVTSINAVNVTSINAVNGTSVNAVNITSLDTGNVTSINAVVAVAVNTTATNSTASPAWSRYLGTLAICPDESAREEEACIRTDIEDNGESRCQALDVQFSVKSIDFTPYDLASYSCKVFAEGDMPCDPEAEAQQSLQGGVVLPYTTMLDVSTSDPDLVNDVSYVQCQATRFPPARRQAEKRSTKGSWKLSGVW
ncbi:hypothetical protein K504DRAFT_491646 [Pleomassaria siparia CBS 279.74]|uniref:Uncharacterized protein n=1 Tax=Pleomassaria siparia CBS 279.74 TaxID=1314801 RepID=A0A6G1K9B3_9PLEO|nr:hypothetical protein K504DRAFT_491646 [Pleomassaria siparia CBS 279.74]